MSSNEHITEEVDLASEEVFVARDRQLNQLWSFLGRALQGQGGVCFVSGEAGTGKSALVAEFARRAQVAYADLVVSIGTCNAHTGIGDPYLPFREVLGLLTGDVETQERKGEITKENANRLRALFVRSAQVLIEVGPDLLNVLVPGAGVIAKLGKATADKTGWLDRLGALAQGKRKPKPLTEPPSDQSRIFEQYTRVLQALAAERPLLLVLDDLHWADASSISLLFHLGRRIGASRILIVGTYRPEEVALGRGGERHPLDRVLNEFTRYYGDISVDLSQIAEAEGRRFVDAFLDTEPNRLSQDFRQALFQLTGGHALFTVELLRNLQLRGDLVQDGQGRWIESPNLDWSSLPARVEGVIEERIDRLDEELRRMLEVASVEGSTFAAEVVARIDALEPRHLIRRFSGELERQHRLIRAQGVRRLDAGRLSLYRFLHSLFQKYLYDELDPVERAYLHEDVGTALEDLYGGQATEIAAQLARHFQQAGVSEKAVEYRLQAGKHAIRASAYQEALEHLKQGLELIQTWPHDPKQMRYEMAFQAALGPALVATQGWGAPDAERAYTRARELGQLLGNPPELVSAIYGLATMHEYRGEFQRSESLMQEQLQLPQMDQDDEQLLQSYELLSCSTFHQGAFAQSLEHAERGLTLYGTEQQGISLGSQGVDLGVSCQTWGGLALWFLGYPDRALDRIRTALQLAENSGHGYSLAQALTQAACLHQLRGEVQLTQQRAETAMTYATDQGFPYFVATGMILHGWALAAQGQADGLEELRRGLAALEKTGAHMDRPYYLGLLADAYAMGRQLQKGLSVLTEAIEMVRGSRAFFYQAELYRMQGSLLLQADPEGNLAEAEASFQQALASARRQQAWTLELRAALNLARLWQRRGKGEAAGQLLAGVLAKFTEGHDTSDLKDAEALLRELN